MKRHIWILAIIASLMFFQTALAKEEKENVPQEGGKVVKSLGEVRIPEVFSTRQIKDWQVIDNKNIIIDTYGYGKFKATFAQPCNGIHFTDTIGFLTQGPYSLDHSTTIILSNGETCKITDLVPYAEEDKGEGH